MRKSHRLAALAAVLVVGAATPANAVPVTYTTSGVFGSSGTNNFLTRNGITITYNSVTTGYDANPTSQANFGSFTVTTTTPPTTATYDPMVDTFTLKITQATPSPTGSNEATFSSTVNGTITFFANGLGQSSAFVQFGTVEKTIVGTPSVIYRIAEGDGPTAGRVNISTGAGVNSIEGTVTITAPEPGTMALACAALPLLGLGYARRRRRNA